MGSGGGYYTELQSGLKPTQQQVFRAPHTHLHPLADNAVRTPRQVFTLPGGGSVHFTEVFKPMRRAAPLPADYANATALVGDWWESPAGVPASKAAAMEAFFRAHEDVRHGVASLPRSLAASTPALRAASSFSYCRQSVCPCAFAECFSSYAPSRHAPSHDQLSASPLDAP